MESSSNANAALTEATNKRKKMDAHNAACQRNRLRKKIQNEGMKKELEENKFELQRMKNEMQEYKRAVEEQKAKIERMRQFRSSLEIEGQNFSNSEQMEKYLLSRTYEPHHQGPDNPITASDPRSSFVANNIGVDAPDNNLSFCDPAAGIPDFGAGSSGISNWTKELFESAGIPDFGAGSSFDANGDEEFFDWMEKLKFDTAAVAGISETTNLVVENQNNELVYQIDHNALSDHSPCDPAAGPYNTNITACVPCPSFVANYKCFDVPNNNLSYCDHVAGVLDSGAGSSFHANDGDLNSDWVGKMSKPDAAADISQTENLVVENQNNELVNQIDHNAMVQRRELSSAQRSAENESDRQHMPEYKIKPELMRNVVVKYEEIAPLFNTFSQLAEESKQMNNTEPNLARRIQEVDNIFRQHIQEMHNKSFDHGSESSHTVMYTA